MDFKNAIKTTAFLLLPLVINGCGIYSFTGAHIEGKTLHFHNLENQSKNILPTLSQILTEKIRNRIVSQTGLGTIRTNEADYDISGTILNYDVSVTGLQSNQQVAKNRLTIGVEIDFKNKLNEKQNFKTLFTRFSDFDGSQTIQSVESKLIDEIGTLLAEDIFNKAFVNW